MIAVCESDSSTGSKCGEGKLLYNKYRNYEPEEASVEFFFTQRKGNLLKQCYNGSNLEMSWSHQQPKNDPGALQQKKRIKKEEQTVQTTNSGDLTIPTGSHVGAAPTNTEEEDEMEAIEDSKHTRRQDAHQTVTHPPQDVGVPTKPSHIATSQHGNERTLSVRAPSGVDVELDPIESNGTRCNETAKVIQQSAAKFFEHLISGSRLYMDRLGVPRYCEVLRELVLHELRVDMVSELHRNFRAPQSIQSNVSDIQQKCTRISVSCTLETFVHVARCIKSSSVSSSAFFFPSYEKTQRASTASSRFTVYFKDLNSLCTAIGFNDDRDFNTLHWREKSHDNTFYSRILGSLSSSISSQVASTNGTADDTQSTSSESSAPSTDDHEKTRSSKGHRSLSASTVNNEDVIFIGLSMNATRQRPNPHTINVNPTTSAINVHNSTLTESHQQTETQSAQILTEPNPEVEKKPRVTPCVALTRRKTLWDEETNSYLSNWVCDNSEIIVEPPPAQYFYQKDKRLDGVFALRWDPKAIPRTSAWTSDALRTGQHVLGKLEAIIPWVLLSGDQCSEIGDILSKQRFKLK